MTRDKHPIIPTQAILLPSIVAPIELGRPSSIAAVEAAIAGDARVLVVPQIDPATDEPGPADLLKVGVIADIIQIVRHQRDRYTVLVRAADRVRIEDILAEDDGHLSATFTKLTAPEGTAMSDGVVSVVRRHVRAILASEADDLSHVDEAVAKIGDADALADFAAARLALPRDRMLALLMEPSADARLRDLLPDLERYVEVLERTADIRQELQDEVSEEERMRALRDRKRAIQEELGEDDEPAELGELAEQVAARELPEETRAAVDKELRRLRQMNPQSAEYTTSKTYLDRLLAIPWDVRSEDRADVAAARELLDAEHEGLRDVKRRILELIAVRQLAPGKHSPIMCLVGPPGVGKTSIGRSVARALGREYVRISLGGVRDESEIRGHRRTYIGALPGRIVAGLEKAGTMNPVFVLDEIDKVGSGVRGDPASALLEVLDPEQNSSFSDHYLEVPVDLSQVLFLATANGLDTIPGPLLDRMEVIEIPGYTDREKHAIARNHLLPKQLAEHGLDGDRLAVTDAALEALIHEYTREAGVRNLERQIGALCRHAAVEAAMDPDWLGAIEDKDLASILGPPPFGHDPLDAEDQVGVVAGMSWTPVGGSILHIEARLMPGKGTLQLTGQVGPVMEESVRAAYSWLRANADRFRIPARAFADNDVHVHVPAGAVRKDGPSAGVAVTTALVSLFTGRAARRDVSLTGEVTLRGIVLPVGGVKEKVLAAHRAGIRRVILPERNRKDTEQIPSDVLEELDVRFVSRVDQALRLALRRPAAQTLPKGRPGGTSNELTALA